ncbi:AEC family transporter [Clostridia bacterium]|nr:AEC family transporter [Clostridia bacterium]
MEIVSNLFILFIIILLGYGCRRYEILPKEAAQVIVQLILRVTLPALILVSMNLEYSRELATSMLQIAAVAVAFTALVIVLAKVISKRLTLDESQKRQWSFALIFGNVTFIGYPVAYLVLGQHGIFLSAIFDFVQSVLMFTYGIYLLSADKSLLSSAKKLGKDPVILSLILGIVLFLLGIPLPEVLQTALHKIGSITSVLSMLAVGLLLQFRGFKDKTVRYTQVIVVFLKLLILPLLFLLIAPMLHLSTETYTVAVIMIACPTAILSTVLSEKYAQDGKFAAGSVFLTHLFCLITLPFILKISGII